MSAKRRTTALASGVRKRAAIASARRGLELPATSLIAPFAPAIHPSPAAVVAGVTIAVFPGQVLTGSPSEHATNSQSVRGGHNNYVRVMAIRSDLLSRRFFDRPGAREIGCFRFRSLNNCRSRPRPTSVALTLVSDRTVSAQGRV